VLLGWRSVSANGGKRRAHRHFPQVTATVDGEAMRSVDGSLRPATSGTGAEARTQNLVFDGVGPGQGFSTNRTTLMAEEYGEAKFPSK
jgi:hypothetical protein